MTLNSVACLRIDSLAVFGVQVYRVCRTRSGGVYERFVIRRSWINQVGNVLFVQLEYAWGYMDAVRRAYASALIYRDDQCHAGDP